MANNVKLYHCDGCGRVWGTDKQSQGRKCPHCRKSPGGRMREVKKGKKDE
jgi:hypothetical protein